MKLIPPPFTPIPALLREALPGIMYLAGCAPIAEDARAEWHDWADKARAAANHQDVLPQCLEALAEHVESPPDCVSEVDGIGNPVQPELKGSCSCWVCTRFRSDCAALLAAGYTIAE